VVREVHVQRHLHRRLAHVRRGGRNVDPGETSSDTFTSWRTICESSMRIQSSPVPCAFEMDCIDVPAALRMASSIFAVFA